jgi:uncharacterized protein YgiM (DUF1202 family)
MLFGTHYMVSKRSFGNPFIAQTDIGREGVIATTDVNLRPDPSTANQPVGVAERGSRVRVLSVNDQWYEVQVIEHGRERRDPDSLDRGWIRKSYIRFD